MRIDRLVVGALYNNCFVVSSDAGEPVVVIDPGDDAEVIIESIAGRAVAGIVLTHGHFDHLQAAAEIKRATNAPLLIHAADADSIGDAGSSGGTLFGFDHEGVTADHLLADGDVLEAGALKMRVLHTPGHTPGGICLFVEADADDVPHLFAGDTLFAGSVGRTDFPGGDPRALRDSIASKLVGLPDETRVHPGHGPDTSIGRESRANPFFPRA